RIHYRGATGPRGGGEPGELPQVPARELAAVQVHPVALPPRRADDAEKLAGAHFPVTSDRIAFGAGQFVEDLRNPDVIDGEIGELKTLRLGAAVLVDRAVPEPERQVGAARSHRHEAAVGVDDPPGALEADIVDRHVAQATRIGL